MATIRPFIRPTRSNQTVCGVEVFLRVLEGKWGPLVIRELLQGPRRFGQLHSALAPISAKTLTDRLRAFEKTGLLIREVFPEVPPRVLYELTPLGASLRPVLDSMAQWGDDHLADIV